MQSFIPACLPTYISTYLHTDTLDRPTDQHTDRHTVRPTNKHAYNMHLPIYVLRALHQKDSWCKPDFNSVDACMRIPCCCLGLIPGTSSGTLNSKTLNPTVGCAVLSRPGESNQGTAADTLRWYAGFLRNSITNYPGSGHQCRSSQLRIENCRKVTIGAKKETALPTSTVQRALGGSGLRVESLRL